MVVGIVIIIAFVLYGEFSPLDPPAHLMYVVEIYMPLNRPLIPMHLFKSLEYCVITILAVLGGMIYYSMNGKHSRFEHCISHCNLTLRSSHLPDHDRDTVQH